MKNLYNLIPDGGHGISDKLQKFIEESSDINEIFSGAETLEDMEQMAAEMYSDFFGEDRD